MCDGSSQHFVFTYLGMGQTRATLAPFAAFAKGTQSSRVFLSTVGGAVVSDPRMWYFPSPDLMAGVGRPSISVPMKARFERRSKTTVLPRVSPRQTRAQFRNPYKVWTETGKGQRNSAGQHVHSRSRHVGGPNDKSSVCTEKVCRGLHPALKSRIRIQRDAIVGRQIVNDWLDQSFFIPRHKWFQLCG